MADWIDDEGGGSCPLRRGLKAPGSKAKPLTGLTISPQGLAAEPGGLPPGGCAQYSPLRRGLKAPGSQAKPLRGSRSARRALLFSPVVYRRAESGHTEQFAAGRDPRKT